MSRECVQGDAELLRLNGAHCVLGCIGGDEIRSADGQLPWLVRDGDVVSEADSGVFQKHCQMSMQGEFRCRDGVFMCAADVPQIGITQILKIHILHAKKLFLC